MLGMYREPIGSLIEKIGKFKNILESEVNDMTELLARTDPDTYSKFLRYMYMKYQVINTSESVEIEINNFDFNGIGNLTKEDLSGKSVCFIFIVDMFTDEFELPLEIASNFNYVRAWAKQKMERKEQLNNLGKEFKEVN